MSDEWPEIALGEACTIESRLVDPRDPQFAALAHVAPDNIESGTGRLIDLRPVGECGLISGKFPFDCRHVLYSKIRPNLRKAALPSFNGLCSADMYPLTPAPGVERDFLFHLLLSGGFTAYATSCAGRTGIPKVNREELFAYRFGLPPLCEQKKIAAVLSSVDQAIEASERTLDSLARLHSRAIEDLLSTLAGSELSEIGHVGEVRYGLTVNKARRASPATRPYLRVANVHRGRLDLSEMKDIGVSEGDVATFELRRDDVLCVEGHGNRDEIGRCALWQDEIPGCLHQNHILRIRPDPGRIRARFLVAYLNSNEGREYFLLHAKTSSGLNTINSTVLARCPVPLPAMDEQRRVEELDNRLRDRISSEQRWLARLRRIKLGIMHDLLTGHRRVPLAPESLAPAEHVLA